MTYYNFMEMLNAGPSSDGKRTDENTILYHIEYCFLLDKINHPSLEAEKSKIRAFIEDSEVEPGLYNKRCKQDVGLLRISQSHDNLTAICAFSKKYGDNYHKKIWERINFGTYNDPKIDRLRVLHPRDMIYYGYLNNNILCILLMPLLLIMMMLSCRNEYKINPPNYLRFWYKLKGISYTTKQFRQTDGKLLSFVRCYGADLNLSYRLCSWIMKYNKVCGSFKEAFGIYFPTSHPINKLLELVNIDNLS